MKRQLESPTKRPWKHRNRLTGDAARQAPRARLQTGSAFQTDTGRDRQAPHAGEQDARPGLGEMPVPPWLPPLALKGRDDHWHRPPDCARGSHAVLAVLPAVLIPLKFAAPSLSTMSGTSPAPRPPPAAWPRGSRSGIVGRIRVAHVAGQHGAGIVVRPRAGSAQPFASSCGDGPCTSSAKRTAPTRTRTRHPLQNCAGHA